MQKKSNRSGPGQTQKSSSEQRGKKGGRSSQNTNEKGFSENKESNLEEIERQEYDY